MVAALLSSCSGEETRSTSDQAEVIRSFSQKNMALGDVHKELLNSWAGLSRAETKEAFVEEIEYTVLPSLGVYLSHLEAIRTKNQELRAVHHRLVLGYKDLEQDLVSFVAAAPEMTQDEATKRLGVLFRETRDHEAVYWQDIQNIYNKHGFQMSQSGRASE